MNWGRKPDIRGTVIRDILAAKTLEHPFGRNYWDDTKPTLIYIPGKIKVKVFFAWYDFWVGFYYDREFKELYVCPFPCVVFKFYRVTKVVERWIDEDSLKLLG